MHPLNTWNPKTKPGHRPCSATLVMRRNERGSVLVISLIVLVGLMSLGAIAVMSARTDTRTGGLERGERVALYAAEAGIAAAQEYLRSRCNPSTGLNPLGGQSLPRQLPNNPQDKPPLGDPDASYDVTFAAEGLCDGTRRPADTGPACVMVRSRGEGPGGATTLLRLTLSHPCEAGTITKGIYGQGGGEARIAGAESVMAIEDTGSETTTLPGAGP